MVIEDQGRIFGITFDSNYSALVLRCHPRQQINCFHFVWLFQSRAGCSVLCHNVSQARSALELPAVRSCKAVPLGIGTSGITLERIEDHNRMCKLMYLVLEIRREAPLLHFLHGVDLLPPFLLHPFSIRKTQLKSHCLLTCRTEYYFVACAEFVWVLHWNLASPGSAWGCPCGSCCGGGGSPATAQCLDIVMVGIRLSMRW